MEQEMFDSWNNKKKEIHFGKEKEFYVNPREIWYIHTGINIGYETLGKGGDFKRPVL